MAEPLIFKKSVPGRKSHSLPQSCDIPAYPFQKLIPLKSLRKSPPHLPEISELDLVRHYTRLSQMNFGVDKGFYPLGSCTMKYNPKINEEIARLPGFRKLHPYQPEELSQGILQILYETEKALADLCGMARFCLHPAAGAHGELLGMLMIRAYHREKGNPRKKVIIPDSSHGTNPASAARCNYQVMTIESNAQGEINIEALSKAMDEEVAALMITNPNTLGLFESKILEIAEIIHEKGGLLYLDGANMNALLEIARPGDMEIDVVQLNLHKTFSTPHGGGGPGSGPVGVGSKLVPFLPVPVVDKDWKGFFLNYALPDSIGKIRTFYGNIGVVIKAYAYLRGLGRIGLRKVAENAIINANYLKERLKKYFLLPFDRPCLHEFVLSVKNYRSGDIRALDVGKRILDYGFHAPTVHFPLIVEDALMMEPTETESKETLDEFVEAMIKIHQELEEEPEKVRTAPHNTPVTRAVETAKTRRNLRWRDLK